MLHEQKQIQLLLDITGNEIFDTPINNENNEDGDDDDIYTNFSILVSNFL